MKYLISVILIVFSTNALAEIYMKQEKNGSVTYSDSPMKNSKTVTVTDEMVTSVKTNNNATSKEEQTVAVTAVKRKPYTKFVINSPKNEETLQNQPSLDINFAVEPELSKDDKIQIIFDGKKLGEPVASSNINVGRVNRGTHELYGLIVDKDNKSIKQSNVITIFVQQAHIGSKKRRPLG